MYDARTYPAACPAPGATRPLESELPDVLRALPPEALSAVELYLLTHDVPADRIVRVDGLGTVNAASDGNAVTVKFPEDAYVIGVSAIELTGAAAGQGMLAASLTVGDNQMAFITNGARGDFLSFAALMGFASNRWARILRVVKMNDTWSVQVRNRSAGTGYTPEIAFATIRVTTVLKLLQLQNPRS